MGAPRFEKHVMLAFADEANSKLRMPEGPLEKLWGWKCSTPAEHVFDPCSHQLGAGSHVCMRGRRAVLFVSRCEKGCGGCKCFTNTLFLIRLSLSRWPHLH